MLPGLICCRLLRAKFCVDLRAHCRKPHTLRNCGGTGSGYREKPQGLHIKASPLSDPAHGMVGMSLKTGNAAQCGQALTEADFPDDPR